MANWNEPTNNTSALNVLTALNDKIANAAKMDFAGDTNLPSGVIRYNTTSKQFESWNGSVWAGISMLALFTDGTAGAPSISFAADTNTGIFRSGDDYLSFTANGITTTHYDGNGLVLGSSAAASSSPGTGVIRGSYGGGTNIAGAPITIIGGRSTGNAAGGHIAFQTSAAGSSGSTANTLTERMRITSAGDVVFGNGDSSASPADGIIRATNGSGSNIGGGSLSLYGGNSTGSAAGGIVRFFTAPAGSSGSTDNTPTERMRIDSDGLLRIRGGTYSPPATNAGILNYNSVGGDFTIDSRSNAGSTDIRFRTSLSGSGAERMRVKPNGQVRFIPLAADPAGAEDGDVYYNSATNKLRVRAGGAWVDLH